MRRSQGGLAVIPMALVLALLWTLPALAAKTRLLLFPFALVNTSPVSTSPAERARLELLDAQLRAALEKSGKYALVDTAPVQAEVAYGWVQKVSTLILNINLLIEDTKSGKIVHGGSVDIRGDTDQSWTRGLAFLLQEHVFND
jgi:hypothetical protein